MTDSQEKARRNQRKKEQKAEKARQKARFEAYRERRKAQLTPQTLTCPPELSVPTPRKQFFGTLCRFLVVLFAVFAMAFFISDAFGFSDSGLGIIQGKRLLLWAFLTCAFCALPYFWAKKRFSVPLAILGICGLCFWFFYGKNGLVSPVDAFCTAFNCALTHMADLGYYALGEKLLPYGPAIGVTSVLVPYLEAAVFAFTLLVALLYTWCLMRRIPLWKLLLAGIFSAAILFVIFEYNTTRSNWGVTFLIASFSGALVMAAYDFLFLRKRDKNAEGPFADAEKPALPAILARKAEEKANQQKKAAQKAIKKAEEKSAPVKTVDEEISDYFTVGKPQKGKKSKETAPRLSPAEKKEARDKKRAEVKELRAYKAYRQKRLSAACAAGGFTGFAVFLLAFLILLLPAFTSTGPNTMFDRAGKSFESYREYVTALLMGDEPVLNTLAYERDESNFEAQDTAPKSLWFSGAKLFTVESNLRIPVYFRGWIATSYNNETGVWTTPDKNSVLYQNYRNQFGTAASPAEDMLYGFWNLTEPGSIPDPTVYNYTKQSKSNSSLGFATTQINIVREKDFKSKTLYMPAFSLSAGGFTDTSDAGTPVRYLRQYGTAEQSKISYANIYDGIYSAYGLTRQNDGIATVSTLTTMKTQGFYRNLAENIAEVDKYRAVLSGQTSQIYGSGGAVQVIREDGTEVISYRVVKGTIASVLGNTADGAAEDKRNYTFFLLPLEVGTAAYRTDGANVLSKTVIDIPADKRLDEHGEEAFYAAPSLPLAIRYLELMTPEEQAAAKQYMDSAKTYTNYVSRYYPTSQENEKIHELAQTIASGATKEVSMPVDITDPVTGETYQTTRTVEQPADFSLANVGVNTVGTSLSAESVRQRHELVMAVIDYLTDEDNYTYTLTPAPTATDGLVGVEQFLFGGREGSCTQFATAAALILRDFGIPTRYVTGYIATNFTASTAEDHAGTYITSVRDSNAHAWIEVWYDYVGWVQYECTPAYYGEMYPVPSEPYTPRPVEPAEDEPIDDPGEDDPIVEPKFTPEQLAEMERQRKEAEFKALLRKIFTVVAFALAAAALIVFVFVVLWRKAKKAQKKRDALVAKIAAAGNAGAEQPTREEFRQLSELTTYLLALCKLSPTTGEFREDYAARLAKACAASLATPVPIEGVKEHEKPHYAMTAERTAQALGAVAAEEFGYGASPADMPLLARFYRRMRTYEYPHRVPAVKRLWLWLIRNKI